MPLKLLNCDAKPVLELDNGFTIGLDCPLGECTFVSHAHSDHSSAAKRAKRVVASAETLSLMRARGASTSFETLEPECIGAGRVELLDSGHVLGGKQLFAESGGESFLYTGDFKLSESLTAAKAVVPCADTLLVECTYGAPEFEFPPREAVYRHLAEWAAECLSEGKIAVVGAYALGKAQEVVACLNHYAGIVPVVNGDTHRVCEAYAKHGVALDYRCVENSSQYGKMAAPFAAVVPPGLLRADLAQNLAGYYDCGVRTAVATGWSAAGVFAGVDEAFALSDHEDYNGLVSLVKRASPSKVYCTHGFSDRFASELREMGFDAEAFNTAARKPNDARQELLSVG